MDRCCLNCKFYKVIYTDGDGLGDVIEQYGCDNDKSFFYRELTYRHDSCDKFESYESQFE